MPRCELLINFLENNGKNLKEFYVSVNHAYCYNSLNLAIANFCPNLRKLSTGFRNNELETLKIVFTGCEYLERFYIWCGGSEYLSENEALEMFVKYSPKDIHELILVYQYVVQSELLPDELESFFLSWMNRILKKSLSLVIVKRYLAANGLDRNDKNMEIIKKYFKLGVIKKFIVI